MLDRVTDTEALQVSQFPHHIRPCLESLDLTMVDISGAGVDTQAFCKYINFKHNTSLQTLYFDQLIICEPYPGRLNVARYVPEVLKTVRSPMKELVLRVQINTVDDLEVIDWDEIISTIKANENWSSLERVVVAGPRKEILKQATEWMRVRLRGLGGQVNVRRELLPRIQVLGVRMMAPPSQSVAVWQA
ncbi:hypothetical protein CYLTODRAFT_249785 [Cylindrobasidium torrendii FP15055 ss-10]|uniref:F-box domain-containing protein n=1 Tax=Cylindrobasidium torrendii FP15055 ss-10 TaxID=1314674 RepID=A0A0D7AUT7_9AGAR|nr:hypothetical protein CYLTODRAFT_249785 [Cylindrobasidium torrendii FP15055 ss-10]